MGNFPGHILPGLCFMLMGLLLFLRSLADVPALQWLRLSRHGIFLSPALKFGTGVVGICAEFVDMIYHDFSTAGSHFEHLKLLTLITVMGVTEALHMRRVISGPFWPYVQPAFLLLISVMLSSHEQEHRLMELYHQMSGLLSLLMAVTLAGDISVSMHSKHRLKVYEEAGAADDTVGRELRDLHPMYYNQSVYRTLFPMATAVLLFINGTWWWQMAFSFFINVQSIPAKYLDGAMAPMYMYGAFFNHVIGVVLGAALLEMLLKRLSPPHRPSLDLPSPAEPMSMLPLEEEKLS
eukprot:TRINITY_DN6487_c0_g1_i1.p1 TRINITY_DN6487_c0_g1~~TRINITY_DN6487_c0_g1_i1.p1  ORF type:complete len:293 (+),score=91.12 TRINITY_DN6487_c0_g1_i1:162-1040(+)